MAKFFLQILFQFSVFCGEIQLAVVDIDVNGGTIKTVLIADKGTAAIHDVDVRAYRRAAFRPAEGETGAGLQLADGVRCAADFLFGTIGPRAGKAAAAVFKVVYLLMIVVAALIESHLVWAIDDVANGLMALPNLIGVVALSGLVVKITRNYFDRRHGETVEPMLSAYSEQNEAMKNELAESDYESCD